MFFRIPSVSKAPTPPPLPKTGGSYVLSLDGKRWEESETTDTPAPIEDLTDAANKE